jgi:hypothetical protein
MLSQARALPGQLRAVLARRPVKQLRASLVLFTRAACSSSPATSGQLQHGLHVRDIRNIGIIAHVDAVSLPSFPSLDLSDQLSLTNLQGKTTTTERMLYCSGASHRQGSKS